MEERSGPTAVNGTGMLRLSADVLASPHGKPAPGSTSRSAAGEGPDVPKQVRVQTADSCLELVGG